MRVLLIALLAAISYAQTDPVTSAEPTRGLDPTGFLDLNIDTGENSEQHVACNRLQWEEAVIAGGDDNWCFKRREFRQYDAKNGNNGECTTEYCKAFDGVESAEKCHDIVLKSDDCDEKWGFQWRRSDGRCWAKTLTGSSTASGAYVSGPIDRQLACNPSCSNIWTDNDCKNVKREKECAYHFNYCRKTCGCDYDYWGERAALGIDDATVYSYSSSNDCTDNFADSYMFNCDVYNTAGWCARDAFDQVVAGDGWCQRFPRESWENTVRRDADNFGEAAETCTVRKGRKRWGPFEAYRDDSGMDARVCCCDGSLYDQYEHDGESLDTFFDGWDKENPDGRCMDILREDDKLAWHDIGGWSCRVYASANLCEADGSKGSGWGAGWGSINARSDEEGIDAADACCACGGGWSHPQYDVIPGETLRRLDRHINGGYGNVAWRKVIKFTKVLKRNQDSGEKRYDPELYSYFDTMYSIVKTNNINQQVWDEMFAAWEAMKVHYPEKEWLHN